MKKTAEELAQITGGTLYGDKNVVIDDVASAESAGPHHVTFAKGEYAQHIEEMQAGVILVDELPKHYTKTLLVVDDCRRTFGELIEVFRPEPKYTPGIHPTAVISDSAVIGKDVCIMAYAVIDDEAEIGDGTVVFPHTYIGRHAKVGKNCEINPGAVIHENSVVGDRVVLRAHAVIGGQGFGFSTDEKGHHTHIRQLGRAVIGDDVEIGAATMVDNGALNDTIVGRGTKIDNLVHLGHNVEIGEDCFLIAQVGVAGSTTVGNHCILAGQVGLAGHIHIADNVIIGAKSGVAQSVDKPGQYMGYTLKPHGVWARSEILIPRLPEMNKRIRQLEKKVAAMENKE